MELHSFPMGGRTHRKKKKGDKGGIERGKERRKEEGKGRGRKIKEQGWGRSHKVANLARERPRSKELPNRFLKSEC